MSEFIDYIKINDICSGAFSNVIRVKKNIYDTKYYILKYTQKLNTKSRNQLLNEYQIIRNLKHTNIIDFVEMKENSVSIGILMNYYEHIDLHNYLNEKYLSEFDILKISKQLFSAIDYLHKLNIVHRDIKPENIILIPNSHLEAETKSESESKTETKLSYFNKNFMKKTNNNNHNHNHNHDNNNNYNYNYNQSDIVKEAIKNSDFTLKLIDFGTARTDTNLRPFTDICGTSQYVAPEMIKQNYYTTSVDVWSVGITLYLLASREFPHLSSNYVNNQSQYDDDIFYEILHNNIKYPQKKWYKFSTKFINLLKKLLEKNCEKRIEIKDAFKNIWFELNETDILVYQNKTNKNIIRKLFQKNVNKIIKLLKIIKIIRETFETKRLLKVQTKQIKILIEEKKLNEKILKYVIIFNLGLFFISVFYYYFFN
jgi:serine/threonine protein kinase